MPFTKVHYFKKISSTNEVAHDLAKKGAKEGEYVVAEQQTHGRGRLQRKWLSKPGNLYVSLILRPKIAIQEASHLTFVASLAVAKTLEKYLAMAPSLKWPNDVLVDGKKIAGILTEIATTGSKIDFVIVGIGMNINQEKFPKSLSQTAASLYQILGKPLKLDQVLEQLLQSFDEWYTAYLKQGFSVIKEMWEEKSVIIGREVEVRDHRKRIKGLALGIDKNGARLLQIPSGETVPVYTGDLICF